MSSSTAPKLLQNRAIHPGRHLADELEARELSSEDLASLVQRPVRHVDRVLRGRERITGPFADALETALDIDSTLWRNLQASYEEALQRLGADPSMCADIELLHTIPWRDFQKQGWIADLGTKIERVGELRTLYDVDALTEIETGRLAVAFRITEKTAVDPWALAAWLQQGEWQAIDTRVSGDSVLAERFDRDLFLAGVDKIRGMTCDAEPWPEMRSLCAAAGVHLEFVPHVRKSGANGATRWLEDGRPLIQLSLLRKRADIFWFTFFHEAAHVLKMDRADVFVHGDELDRSGQAEQNADEFAADTLIPPESWASFIGAGRISAARIQGFAEQVGIHPGIVVGRLHHEKRVLRNRHNDLRVNLDHDMFSASFA